MPSYAFNRSGSPPGDHRSRLGGPCNIPIILFTLCECSPERLPCLVEYLKATQLFPRPYPRFTSYLYKVYETIPPLVTSWYTIWAKVIVIVATYRRVITLLNRESLRPCGADLSPNVVEQLDTTSTTTGPDIRRRMLKGRRDDVSNMADFSRVLGVSIQIVCRGFIRYSRHNLPPESRLPEHLEILKSLPVKLLTQLEIPVLAFQETEIYDIHCPRCTGALNFRNHGSRNDWVWVRAGTEDMDGALRGRLPAKLVALFKTQTTDARIECAASLAFSL